MDNKGKILEFERSGDFYFKLASKLLKQKRVLQAADYFRKAIQVKPQNYEYHFNLAKALSLMGNRKESIKILENAINKFREEAVECYFALACNYFDSSEFNKAKAMFEKYCEINPNGIFAAESQQAIQFISSEIIIQREIQETKSIKLANKGKELLDKNEFSKAIELLKEAAQTDLNNLSARNNLSIAHYLNGQIADAIDVSRGVLKADSNNPYANSNLALFYKSMGSEGMYKKQVAAILKLDYKYVDQVLHVVEILANLGEDEMINRLLNKQVKCHDAIILWHFLAISQYNLSNFGRAVEVWSFIKNKLPHLSIFVDCFITKANKYIDKSWNFGSIEYDVKVFTDYIIKIENLIEVLINVNQEEFNKVWENNYNARDIINYFLYKLDNEKKFKLIDKLDNVNDEDAINILNLYVSKTEMNDEVRSKCSQIIMKRKVAGDANVNVIEFRN
jgi:tetratricopeptide (TPR) repeat protein